MEILELAEKQDKRKNRIFLVMLMQSYQRNAEISAGCILQRSALQGKHKA